MENEFFCIFFIVYSIAYVLCMCLKFYSYLKFKLLVKKNNAVSLMDKLYEIAVCIVGFLYMALYISGFADVFLNINRYEYGNLPFIICAMPLMVITFNILVDEGLSAYSFDKLFIGRKKIYNKENVKICGVYKYSFINRAKITVTIANEVKTKERKLVIRTSLNNLKPFIDLYGK